MPGIGRQPQRHRQGQLVIDDRRRRTAREARDQHLLVGFGIGDDREARHLGAGAGGGRDRDNRRAGKRDLVRHLVVAHPAAIGVEHRHALGRVDRTAAADRDEAVVILPSRIRATPVSSASVVGSGTVSLNTAHAMRASSSSEVARSRMPHPAIYGSVTISGRVRPSRPISPGRSDSAPPPTAISRGAVIRAAMIRSLPQLGFFNTKRSTPPGCSPDSSISHPVVWQKC